MKAEITIVVQATVPDMATAHRLAMRARHSANERIEEEAMEDDVGVVIHTSRDSAIEIDA